MSSHIVNGNVSFWYDEVGIPVPQAPLAESLTADVCIVGAGYTGLWTAYYLKKAAPQLRIVILEERFAGYGASGRNGGWLTNSITGGRDQYVASHGKTGVAAFQHAMNDTVDEVIRVAALEGIDASFVKGGELNIAVNPAQLARIREWADDEHAWGFDDVHLLNAAETAARINIPQVRAGIWHPHCARIQPAKLVQGLRATVMALGVELYENTRVSEIAPHVAHTARGSVTADHIVRATEGFTAGLKGQHRTWLPMNSSIIVTEPLSDSVWQEIGWEGRETLGDMVHVYFYAQRTPDGRIAMGGRGVPYRFGSKTDSDGQTQASTVEHLTELIQRYFPAAASAHIDRVWSGVLGVPRDWAATVGLDTTTGIAWAGGYVGTGVTATNLAGRTLTDLILGRDTALTAMPWVNHQTRKWEVEPLRWLATHGLYAAYSAADAREDKSHSSSTSTIARVANIITGRH
jgi:glycine/D-amino acid oxidase-like deaminating enzyme